MNQPLVSVIMPAYNAGEYISDAINSVLGQSYENLEIIVIDDCSTDNTKEVLESYNDKRLFYSKNERNEGIVKSLNRGLEFSRGMYIARMDADDICHKDRIMCQLQFLEAHPELDMVSINPIIMDENGTKLHKSRHFILTSPLALKFASHFESPFTHPACLFKAETLKELQYGGGEDCLHIEDYDLWWRMYDRGCLMANINEPLFYYRVHQNSVSNASKTIQHNNAVKLSEKRIEKLLGIVGHFDNPAKRVLILQKCFKKFSNIYYLSDIDIREIKIWIGKYVLKYVLEEMTLNKVSFFSLELLKSSAFFLVCIFHFLLYETKSAIKK